MLVPSMQRDRHVHADVAELALQHLRHVLAHGEARLRDERERERLPVLLADAVAVGVAPAGFVEQRARAAGSNGYVAHVVGCTPTTRAESGRA